MITASTPRQPDGNRFECTAPLSPEEEAHLNQLIEDYEAGAFGAACAIDHSIAGCEGVPA